MYDFLLVINSNLGSASHRLRYGDLLVENREFSLPLSFITLGRGDPFRVCSSNTFTDPGSRVLHGPLSEDFVTLAGGIRALNLKWKTNRRRTKSMWTGD